jgi:serine/threonine protein phosphatase PrpC
MITYGVVVRVVPEKAYGLLRSADGNSYALTFLFKEFLGAEEELAAPLPVTFVERPHPRDPSRRVAREVRPASDLPTWPGAISWLGPAYGFVRLADGREAYFHRSFTTEEGLQRGERVECVVVPGKDGRMFILALRRVRGPLDVAARPVAAPPAVSCGAASLRGRRSSKSVNDDSFLIDQLPGGMWLLAVADGVSKPSHGWWASDKCTELLWRSSRDYAQRLLEAADHDRQVEVMNDWIRSVHEDFLAERRRQSLADYQSATTTLTFAVVRGRRLLFANCGDTPLYRFQRKSNQLKGLIGEVWTRSRGTLRGQTTLSQHMAGGKKDWHPVVSATHLEQGDLVVLCSDGVASGERSREKYALLNRGLGDERRDLQQRVADVLNQIAELGEADDLTLLALKPEETP